MGRSALSAGAWLCRRFLVRCRFRGPKLAPGQILHCNKWGCFLCFLTVSARRDREIPCPSMPVLPLAARYARGNCLANRKCRDGCAKIELALSWLSGMVRLKVDKNSPASGRIIGLHLRRPVAWRWRTGGWFCRPNASGGGMENGRLRGRDFWPLPLAPAAVFMFCVGWTAGVSDRVHLR